MKIVRFTKSTDFNGRHYSRADSYEFPDEVADKLIADGLADLPVDSRILSDDAKAQIVSELEPVEEIKPAPKKKAGKK